MTNAEKLQKAMDEASRLYKELPDWMKVKPTGSSASVERTVRPTSRGDSRRRDD
jgi:hypothetical protein